MGKKSRLKRQRRECAAAQEPFMWANEVGVQAIGLGQRPNAEELAAMTAAYQERVRNSELWTIMVKEFGEEKAAEMLSEFTVKAAHGA